MASGQTRDSNEVLRVPALHKDRHQLSVAFTFALLYDTSRPGQGDCGCNSRRHSSLC